VHKRTTVRDRRTLKRNGNCNGGLDDSTAAEAHFEMIQLSLDLAARPSRKTSVSTQGAQSALFDAKRLCCVCHTHVRNRFDILNRGTHFCHFCIPSR
jgi:hypothetical protein